MSTTQHQKEQTIIMTVPVPVPAVIIITLFVVKYFFENKKMKFITLIKDEKNQEKTRKLYEKTVKKSECVEKQKKYATKSQSKETC